MKFFCFFPSYRFDSILFLQQTDAIRENILNVADKYLLTGHELVEKTNEENKISSKFLRSLDTVAVYTTRQLTRRQRVFRKQNVALAIRNKSNSFTFFAKDESILLDIQTADGEAKNPISMGRDFLCHNLFLLDRRVSKCIPIYMDMVYCFHKQ